MIPEMNKASLILLINNTALMLSMSLVFDMISFRGIQCKASVRQAVPGIFLRIIGISVMLNPWELAPGAFFDTRSILI